MFLAKQRQLLEKLPTGLQQHSDDEEFLNVLVSVMYNVSVHHVSIL